MSQIHKIVINASYGGFVLSDEARSRLKELCQENGEQYDYEWILPRHDPILVQVVEELGSERASAECATLRVVSISGRTYRISDYDGHETIITPNLEEWTVIG